MWTSSYLSTWQGNFLQTMLGTSKSWKRQLPKLISNYDCNRILCLTSFEALAKYTTRLQEDRPILFQACYSHKNWDSFYFTFSFNLKCNIFLCVNLKCSINHLRNWIVWTWVNDQTILWGKTHQDITLVQNYKTIWSLANHRMVGKLDQSISNEFRLPYVYGERIIQSIRLSIPKSAILENER